MEAILVFIGFNMIIALVIGLAASWVLSRKAYDLRSTAAPVIDLFFDGVRA